MHFSGMHAYSSYEACQIAMKFEVECLKEQATAKSQSSVNFISEQSKTKSDKKSNKRKDLPKFGKSDSDGGPGTSVNNKMAHRGKKTKNRGKTKAKCHRCGERSLRS